MFICFHIFICVCVCMYAYMYYEQWQRFSETKLLNALLESLYTQIQTSCFFHLQLFDTLAHVGSSVSYPSFLNKCMIISSSVFRISISIPQISYRFFFFFLIPMPIPCETIQFQFYPNAPMHLIKSLNVVFQ